MTIAVDLVQGQQCQWTAQPNGFLRVDGASSGSGSGTVVISADANTGASRMSTVSVAGATVLVSQAGANCVVSVSPEAQTASAAGGTFTVNVSAPANCAWSIETTGFVTLSGPLFRSGAAQLSYQVPANHSEDARVARLFIDRFVVTVNQAGAQ